MPDKQPPVPSRPDANTRPLHAPHWGDVVADTVGKDSGGGAFSLTAANPRVAFVAPEDRPFFEIYASADVHVYSAAQASEISEVAGSRRRVNGSLSRSLPIYPGGVVVVERIDADATGEGTFGG